jgi:transglutaminase-like putative cysteine protease
VKIRLVHVTRFDYSADVVEGVMEVRLGPLSDATQRWDRFQLSVSPSGTVRQFVDGFGNRTLLVTVGRPHRTLEVTTRSELSTMLDNPFALPAKPPRALSPSEEIDYLSPSPLVRYPLGAFAVAGLATLVVCACGAWMAQRSADRARSAEVLRLEV